MGDDAENLAPVMASRATENRSGGLTILLIATLIGSVLLNLALLAFLAGNA